MAKSNTKTKKTVEKVVSGSDVKDLVNSTVKSLKAEPKSDRVQVTVHYSSATTQKFVNDLCNETGKTKGTVLSELIDQIAAIYSH